MSTVEKLEALLRDTKDKKTIKAVTAAILEINHLREWIAEEGTRTDTCTYNVLKQVCDNCGCLRKK